MDRQIIEISNDGFNLSLYRGFLVVENKNQGLKSEIPLDNILALILSANNVSVTKNIINAIAEHPLYRPLADLLTGTPTNRLLQTAAKKFVEKHCSKQNL